MNRRGQVTVFIIVAILIVAIGVSIYFFKDNLFGKSIPSSIEPVYNNFLNCLEEDVLTGISVLSSQGGHITLPKYEVGSEKYPSSSQLNFAGNPIPYWYYVNGAGVQNEQIPTTNDMEKELSSFIDSRIENCNFQAYYDEGYEITIQNPDTKVNIREMQVDLDLKADMLISKGDERYFVSSHNLVVKSNLGKLYSEAKQVYEREQKDLFLEEYGIDFLRNYAPVDGVELTCAPKVWEANSVFDDLSDAVEVNTQALKNSNDGEYFSVDIGVNDDVVFLNSKSWPSSYEVLPADSNILIANPVGNQPGLGILGFCYVSYHFVYNLNYPVLVQVSDGQEIFQFPVVVVISRNQPREALQTASTDLALPELCQYKNTLSEVRVYDINSRLIDANISFECFGTVCDIGKTINGVLEENFPQCANGQIYVSADGYKDIKTLYSTVNSGSVSVLLDKEYEKKINLLLNGNSYNGEAFITFTSDTDSKTITYPAQSQVTLSRGEYEIEVQIYRDSNLNFGATTTEQCVQVPRGILGLVGITKKECFEVDVPEQAITKTLSGGGTLSFDFTESDLKNNNFIDINSQALPVPSNLDELQINYILFDQRDLEVSLR